MPKKITIAIFLFPLVINAKLHALPDSTALKVCNLSKLIQTEPNLTGSGVKLGVLSRSFSYADSATPNNDFLPDVNHRSLFFSQLAFYSDQQPPPSPSPHATAVCSILFGTDFITDPNEDNERFKFRGIAPDAHGSIYEFMYFVREMLFPCSKSQLDVLSISMGTQFEDWWTRSLCRIAERDDLIIVAAIGNGTRTNDSIFYPAASSNVIGVGIVDINSSEPNFTIVPHIDAAQSTHGPSSDNRAKPDLVAPADYPVALAATGNAYGNCGNWTSYAAPLVSASAALLLNEAALDPNIHLDESRSCVIKSLLLTSARKFPAWHKGELSEADDHAVPLDFQYGAGILDSYAALQLLKAGKQTPEDVTSNSGWATSQILPGQSQSYAIHADSNTPAGPITITLAWNRHYQDKYPFDSINDLDSNLRLELWGFNNGTQGQLLDYSDSLTDNVEHIYYTGSKTFQNYVIFVSSPTQPKTIPAEAYAIAWKF